MSCWGENLYGQVMPLEMLFEGAIVCFRGDVHCVADFICFSQLGDGSGSLWRTRPVAVSGLSSGISMIALGFVRLFVLLGC